MTLHIGSLIARHARYRPDHLAVVFGEERLSYAQFYARVNKLVHVLHGLGLRKGDKVATILPNCLPVIEIYWAVAQAGLVVVPLSPLLRGPGLLRLLSDSDSAAIITVREMVDELEPLRAELPIAAQRYLLVDADDMPGYQSYAALMQAAPSDEPPAGALDPHDLENNQ